MQSLQPFIFIASCIVQLSLVPANQLDVYLVLLHPNSPLHLNFDAAKSSTSPKGDRNRSKTMSEYASFLAQSHDNLLQRNFQNGRYEKLYSYYCLFNAFAVSLSSNQAQILSRMPEVLLVERDTGVQKLTTYTPWYMGLPSGAWAEEGGEDNAGEGVTIGIVDTGIDPTHLSFSDAGMPGKQYSRPTRYKGICEVSEDFPRGSCNNKLIGARHFAKAAIASGFFNASQHFASPRDDNGHGTHTASTAAGNSHVPVVAAGVDYGLASGIAPRAHLAIYKAVYKGIGFFADVVAAIDQAVQDGVDILSLSIAPAHPLSGVPTYFNIFDMALLNAVRAGVFVAQGAGNAGPKPASILSFSPWICTVAAAVHDRTYPNSIILRNHKKIAGIGLAPGTFGKAMYGLILATDAVTQESAQSLTKGSVQECQYSISYIKNLVQGRILVCTYTTRFILGDATVRNIVETAKNLSAEGLVILTSKILDGHNYGAVPLDLPAIIVPTFTDSMALLTYYNRSAKFKASARIVGGLTPKFSHEAPKVASYSSRGPDILNSQYTAANVLKPNIMAPGNMIWAAWTPIATDYDAFIGERFAMISGTSMATPHVAGIAALIKQRHPSFSPAAIASSLTTTAFTLYHGNPILAEHPSMNGALEESPGTPLDFGGGEVNPTAALDPGLVFDAGFEDYVDFLCYGAEGSASLTALIFNTTRVACDAGGWSQGRPSHAADLNMPYIAVGNLTSSLSLQRIVTNIAEPETYRVSHTDPHGVSVAIAPKSFTLHTRQSQKLQITLNPTSTRELPCFGSIVFTGNLGHEARIPIVIISKTRTTDP